jgi:NAD-dependent dihydropyrimidine dehydrogenase PreA subunit
LIIKTHECGICGACVDVCPLGLIEKQGLKIIIHEGCNECGACVDSCPLGAIYYDDEVE